VQSAISNPEGRLADKMGGQTPEFASDADRSPDFCPRFASAGPAAEGAAEKSAASGESLIFLDGRPAPRPLQIAILPFPKVYPSSGPVGVFYVQFQIDKPHLAHPGAPLQSGTKVA